MAIANNRSITYVEFGASGHRSIFIRHIAADFASNAPGWRLNVWVPDAFFEQHREIVAPYGPGAAAMFGRVVFKSLSDVTTQKSWGDASIQWKTIRRCVEQDGSAACFIPSLDAAVKEIAFSSWSGKGFKVSGLLFHPFLHYRTFSLDRDKKWPRLRTWLKSYALNLLFFHHPLVAEVLTLDPFAPPCYNRILRTQKMRYLTDYLVETPPLPNPRDYFQLPSDRLVVLFFGSIARRKGVIQFLESIEQAFRDRPELSAQLAVVFAGSILPDIKAELNARIQHIRQSFGNALIQVRDRFLTDVEVSTLICASDVVCALYIQKIGMSGMLTLAAQHRRLVLGSDFGLVGELIRRFQLGVTCDTLSLASIKGALLEALEQCRDLPQERKRRMAEFASRYSAERFSREVRECMLRTASQS
jgi:glycosyltransferase involved in cell wall biosynthesis